MTSWRDTMWRLRALSQVGEALQLLGSLVSEMRCDIRENRVQLDALFSLLRDPKPPVRYATALLLWHDDGSPCFASTTELIATSTLSCHFMLQHPVPAGAWLVAIGAHLGSVLVGNDLMDWGMPDRTPCVKLSLPIKVGCRLSFTLVPTTS